MLLESVKKGRKMSAFLGPIHTWLFGKITFQDELTTGILEKAQEKGYYPGLIDEVNQRYGTLPKGKLEDIIDETNIHGWLQTQVALVEKRLAFVVTALLKEDQERLSMMMGVAYEEGKTYRIGDKATVRDAFELLEHLLLDGMPCDHVNKITEETEEKICWEQTVDLHEPYWAEVGGSVEFYYDIREALVKGLFSGSKITFARINDQKYALY